MSGRGAFDGRHNPLSSFLALRMVIAKCLAMKAGFDGRQAAARVIHREEIGLRPRSSPPRTLEQLAKALASTSLPAADTEARNPNARWLSYHLDLEYQGGGRT